MQELTAHNKIVYNYQNYKSDTCKYWEHVKK